jgi:hypothetical protein
MPQGALELSALLEQVVWLRVLQEAPEELEF